jgi:hypothetical protein
LIPAHEPSTGNLPPGEHPAKWFDVVERFGTTPWRRELLEGLACALHDLRAAGCKRVYIDGSFITTKAHPGDFDACWDADGVDFDVIDEVLLTFDAGRRAQKARYRGELFPADATATATPRESSSSTWRTSSDHQRTPVPDQQGTGRQVPRSH